MFDAWLVASRFASYLGLMLCFGLPAFALHALPGNWGIPIAKRLLRLTGTAAVFGLLASCAGLWAMARGMSGGDSAAAWTTAKILLTQTLVGMTWMVRVGLLMLVACMAMLPIRSLHSRFGVLALLGAGALATLAWAGHGAMSAGTAAWLHLGADIAHLLAAGAWLGALVALVLIARHASNGQGSNDVQLLSHASSGFATLGSTIVAVLLASGTINYVMIVSPSPSGLIANVYGRLLLAKLGLFIGMLALASLNRFRFAPTLERALRGADAAGAVLLLRRSLWVETGLGFMVLALVAVLGTLDPGA